MNENELVKKHLGLVVKIAKNFKPRDNAELEDFIQEGSIALLKALRKHNAKRGKISTLAWKYISMALGRYKSKICKLKEKQETYTTIPSVSKVNAVWEILPNSLSDIEKTVINLRYDGYTFKQIGFSIGYTKSWANRIFKTAIKKIIEANPK